MDLESDIRHNFDTSGTDMLRAYDGHSFSDRDRIGRNPDKRRR